MSGLLARLRGRWTRLRLALVGGRVEIGPGLTVHKGLRVRGPGRIVIGRDCRIDGIPGDGRQRVVLDTHRATSTIRIGDRARLYAARISSRFEIVLGDDVLVEESAIMDTDFHSMGRDRRDPEGECVERCRVVVGDRVAVGARSTVGKGVALGAGCVVRPGSIVTRSFPEDSVVGGNPARILQE